jgi:DNA repair protein SbcD/Mre11
MQSPFRFLQSSDFHLERPPRGLAEVPDHLRAALVEAPYRAAERVFDAAIKERVDFVVLSGDLFDPRTSGPRAPVFLAEQFERLARQDIAVYWAQGRADGVEGWADHWTLPKTVVRFPLHRVDRVVHQRDAQPLLQILGASAAQRRKIRAADFRADGHELFALGVAYGSADVESLAGGTMNCWALGGEHGRRTLTTAPATAHYAGSPQGRRPSEPGPHGCTLVQVDEAGRARLSFIATDAVRYVHEHVTVDEFIGGEQLYQILNERVVELLNDPFGPELLIQWTIVPNKTLASELRRGKLAGDLMARLRAEHGQKRPAAWTVGLDVESEVAVSPQQFDEETLLGEFLRTVNYYVEHADAPLDFEPYLAARHVAGSMASAVAIDDVALRQRVLGEVTRLGAQLLSPQEHRP